VLRSQAINDTATIREMVDALRRLAEGEEYQNHNKVVGQNDISAEKILAAVKALAACRQVTIIFGKGITTQNDPAVIAALHDLSQAIGKISGQPAVMISIKGKANSLAADQLKLDQPFNLQGRQAAYLVLGDDELSKRQLKALQGIPVLIVQAAYRSKLTEIADVVFPVTTWTEQDGHYLNLEGRLQKAVHIFEVPSNIYSNIQVLEALADKLGLPLQQHWQTRLAQSQAVVKLDLDHSKN
jgi:predicted molibdopterin-dependent oxidoreductase YjgC